MTGRADRSAAYAELVSGLLEARHDAASARFDAELAAAEADGRIDERTARVLRWWQRESVRAVIEHARAVIPPALGALDDADADAARHNDDAADAWERATTRPRLDLSPAPAPAETAVRDHRPEAPRAPSEPPRPVPQEPSRPAAQEPEGASESQPVRVPEEGPWAIPAARSASPDLAEPDGPRRLIVAGLNPLPRGSGGGQARRESVLDRHRDRHKE